MSELPGELQAVLDPDKVDVAWNDARTEAAWRGFRRKRARRVAARGVAAAGGIAAIAISLVWWSGGGDGEDVAEPGAVAADDGRLAPENPDDIVLEEIVVTREAGAEIDVLELAPDVIELRVVRGKGRFLVPPRERRKEARLIAGDVEIAVFATEFSVARYDDRTDVWAHRGDVRVIYRGDLLDVPEGEHRSFGAEVGASAGDDTADDAVAEGVARARREAPERSDWRALAEEGDLESAYDVLSRRPRATGVSDLLLAADVYRMSGHPDEAVAPLRRVVTRHARDPRAPLAAFTLGRVLLDDLGRPVSAARAFAKTQALAPSGPLAEDALAREVEAWSKAGKEARARERASIYLERYPRGHRVRAVRNYAGM